MRTALSGRAVLAGLGAVTAVCGVVWLWSAARGPQVRADLRGANVLLVTIDTLRADRLGAYGGRAGLTPTLDALAMRGVRFTRAWSHAPTTLPAHASILTGLLPPRHGVRNNGSFRLGPQPATLAESLRAAGYRTGAFIGAFVLDTRFGLNRGFDEYDDRYDARPEPVSFHFADAIAVASDLNVKAVLYVGLGMTDGAFEQLGRDCVEHSAYRDYLNLEPHLDPLRADPRFADRLRRGRLSEVSLERVVRAQPSP